MRLLRSHSGSGTRPRRTAPAPSGQAPRMNALFAAVHESARAHNSDPRRSCANVSFQVRSDVPDDQCARTVARVSEHEPAGSSRIGDSYGPPVPPPALVDQLLAVILTSSAAPSSVGGTVRPSAFAVLRSHPGFRRRWRARVRGLERPSVEPLCARARQPGGHRCYA